MLGLGRRPADDGGRGRRLLPRRRRGRDRQVAAGGRGPRPGGGQRRAGARAPGACPTTPTSRCGRSRGCWSARSASRRGPGPAAALVARPGRTRAGPGRGRSLPRPTRRGARDPRVPAPRSWTRAPSSTRPSTGSWSGSPPLAGADAAPARRRGPALGRPVHPRPPGPARRARGRPGCSPSPPPATPSAVPWRDAVDVVAARPARRRGGQPAGRQPRRRGRT